MRIGELAQRTGVSVPTIKYYAREGMLPAGERTSPNQVRYDESHVRRLKLIRAMLEVGGLSIAAAREVLAEVDSPGGTVHDMLGVAQLAVSRAAAERGTAEERMLAEREVAELARRHGWNPAKAGKNPGWAMLVQIVTTYRDLGQGEMLVLLDRYAEAASELAAAELAVVGEMAGTDGKIEGVVLGTVLGDAAMAALRRIAQEDTSQRVTARAESA
ncbi:MULTISPECIES: MerR family transcriptional regulator [unclassified Streptomyces]|uniref:MerR family transcriptional regulator n=1 Tax=Streptomyces millisiae TaxID=3075542 RepID=A0ABU2LIC8_9ACTN|nr:MerR family transcriptional regulator [Streptomyces sp. DSM 44918]MDT0317333.1 MerR family transcriptional regulator [Streptomyces sp. DSM 44918]